MAARTRYAPDRGLSVRMTATMFLLGLVFVAFIAAIIGIGAATHASDAAIVLFAIVLGGGAAIGLRQREAMRDVLLDGAQEDVLSAAVEEQDLDRLPALQGRGHQAVHPVDHPHGRAMHDDRRQFVF